MPGAASRRKAKANALDSIDKEGKPSFWIAPLLMPIVQFNDRSESLIEFSVETANLLSLIESVQFEGVSRRVADGGEGETGDVDAMFRRGWHQSDDVEIVLRAPVCTEKAGASQQSQIYLLRRMIVPRFRVLKLEPRRDISGWLRLQFEEALELLEYLRSAQSQKVEVRLSLFGPARRPSLSVSDGGTRAFRAIMLPASEIDVEQCAVASPEFFCDWSMPADGVLTFARSEFFDALSHLRGRGHGPGGNEVFHIIIHRSLRLSPLVLDDKTAIRLVTISRSGDGARVDLVAACSSAVRDGCMIAVRANDLLDSARILDRASSRGDVRIQMGYGAPGGWVWLSSDAAPDVQLNERDDEWCSRVPLALVALPRGERL